MYLAQGDFALKSVLVGEHRKLQTNSIFVQFIVYLRSVGSNGLGPLIKILKSDVPPWLSKSIVDLALKDALEVIGLSLGYKKLVLVWINWFLYGLW